MTLRFETFEVNLEQRELRKGGVRVPLQHKPFRILELLLRQPGSLVTRKELAKDLWPDLHVDFERSLNSAVNSLRNVLGDSPRASRFIETRPGLGYRFIAPVEEANRVARAVSAGGRPGVYHDYLRGRFFLNRMTDEGIQRAMGCFHAALAEDPGCGLAHAGLADAYCQLALSGSARAADVCQPARSSAAAALRVEPELAETHTSLGHLSMVFDWDWKGAEAAWETAACGEAQRARALLDAAFGRHDEALRITRDAYARDPLSLRTGYERAWVLYLAGNAREAVDQCWRVLSLEPAFAPAQTILGLAYFELGSEEEAITELENACVCSGRRPPALASLGYVYGRSGETDRAQQALLELTQLAQRQYVSHYWPALIHAGLGQHELALEALEMACSQRDPLLVWLKADPRLRFPRKKASPAAILRCLGLAESEPKA